jgi:hypothetical protein
MLICSAKCKIDIISLLLYHIYPNVRVSMKVCLQLVELSCEVEKLLLSKDMPVLSR